MFICSDIVNNLSLASMCHSLCFDHEEEADADMADFCAGHNYMCQTYICRFCGEEHHDDDAHHLACAEALSSESE